MIDDEDYPHPLGLHATRNKELAQATEFDPPGDIPWGSSVVLRRGGHDSPPPGQFRDVMATYLGARGNQVCCRLEQDDPDACVGYCTKKGDIGWWSSSIMSLEIDCVPISQHERIIAQIQGMLDKVDSLGGNQLKGDHVIERLWAYIERYDPEAFEDWITLEEAIHYVETGDHEATNTADHD